MGQILHGSARTTQAIRRAIQLRQESVRAAAECYHYETHEQLRALLQLFVDAYNHARRLKTLRGLTPYEHVLQVWTKEPERFRFDPSHHIPGPGT
jgi:hypothetical protein